MALTPERKQEIRTAYQSVCNAIETAKNNSRFSHEVTLVAASKTHSAEEINYLFSLGQKIIGENRVQELCDKYPDLNPNLEIHFIGALQRNKVKYIIDKVSLIHSVDRLELAQEINRQAKKHNKIMNILCEVNLGEEQKSGIPPCELPKLLDEIQQMDHICLRGLMAVPPISHNYDEQFANSKKFMKIFIDISTKIIDNSSIQISSIGMSEDFPAAIAAGANMVRIGTAIFGKRDYSKSH